MSLAVAVSIGLILIGAVARAPGLLLVAILGLAVTGLSTLWSRRGLRDVTYERRLAIDRAVWGDSIELTVGVTNRKLLPLAWLQAEDFVTDGTVVRESPVMPSERPGRSILRNVWTLAPFQEVRRRVHIDAVHRGVHRFESVRLSVADLFGRDVASAEERRAATLIVRPRSVPVRSPAGRLVHLGTHRARRGLIEDPAFFVGVRPFQRGDPRRRIHQRASARTGRPMSKRFEPSTTREVVIALDVQTQEGPHWLLAYDELLVEGLMVAAASLARRFIGEGAACGLAANGWTYSLARTAWAAPRAGDEQLIRIADLLARLSSVASVPFEHVIAELPARLPSGALVFVLSGRDPAAMAPALRRLRGGGFDVRHVALGPNATVHVARGRAMGLDSIQGRLDPDWRTSDAFTLVG